MFQINLSRSLLKCAYNIAIADCGKRMLWVLNSALQTELPPVKMVADCFNPVTPDLKATPLIIMHGLFGSKQNWRSTSRVLSNLTNRKVYSVDARNHGNSPHHFAHSSALMASDVALFMREENIPRACVMGHCMGGGAMMFFALKYPKMVDKLIIVDKSPFPTTILNQIMLKRLLAMKNATASSKLTLAEGRAEIQRQLGQSISEQMIVSFLLHNLKKGSDGEFVWRFNINGLMATLSSPDVPTSPDMNPFEGPTIFIAGLRSKFLSQDDVPKIRKIFPKAIFKFVDSGHIVHFEKPQIFLDIVMDFLNRKIPDT